MPNGQIHAGGGGVPPKLSRHYLPQSKKRSDFNGTGHLCA